MTKPPPPKLEAPNRFPTHRRKRKMPMDYSSKLLQRPSQHRRVPALVVQLISDASIRQSLRRASLSHQNAKCVINTLLLHDTLRREYIGVRRNCSHPPNRKDARKNFFVISPLPVEKFHSLQSSPRLRRTPRAVGKRRMWNFVPRQPAH